VVGQLQGNGRAVGKHRGPQAFRQQPGNLEGGGAAVEDDELPVVGQGRRLAGNLQLFAFGVLFAFAEGEGQGGFGQGPAVYFRQQAGVGQFLEVPPDGVFRNPQFVAQVGGEYFLGLLQFLQDRSKRSSLSICVFARFCGKYT
jgi:hypothetical protein